jgi:hypothetical protein
MLLGAAANATGASGEAGGFTLGGTGGTAE